MGGSRWARPSSPRTTHTTDACLTLPEEALERSRTRHVTQPRQRLLLDLADPLARDPEERPDLLECHWLLAVEPEVQPQDLRLALLEARQCLLDRLGQCLLERLLVRRRVDVVGEIVEQLVVFARRERSVEGEMGLRDRHRLRDLFLGDIHAVSDLGMRCLASELLEQGVGALADAVERAGTVERNAYDPRLLRECLQDRLANPPHGVRDELDALRLVE